MTRETTQMRVDRLIQQLACCPHTDKDQCTTCHRAKTELAGLGYRPDGTRTNKKAI